MDVEWSTVVELEHPWSRYTPSAAVQSTTASRTNNIAFVLIWRISFESFTRGGVKRHKGHRRVIYAGGVGSAVEWRQIQLYTSCDVAAALNQLRNKRIQCFPINLPSRDRRLLIKYLEELFIFLFFPFFHFFQRERNFFHLDADYALTTVRASK